MIYDFECMRMKAASQLTHGFVNFVLIGEFCFQKGSSCCSHTLCFCCKWSTCDHDSASIDV